MGYDGILLKLKTCWKFHQQRWNTVHIVEDEDVVPPKGYGRERSRQSTISTPCALEFVTTVPKFKLSSPRPWTQKQYKRGLSEALKNIGKQLKCQAEGTMPMWHGAGWGLLKGKGQFGQSGMFNKNSKKNVEISHPWYKEHLWVEPQGLNCNLRAGAKSRVLHVGSPERCPRRQPLRQSGLALLSDPHQCHLIPRGT